MVNVKQVMVLYGGGKMDKIDIIRKLSSRKFWVAVIGFVSAMMFEIGRASCRERV